MRIDEELMEIWLNEVCDKVYVVVVIATTLLLKLGARVHDWTSREHV